MFLMVIVSLTVLGIQGFFKLVDSDFVSKNTRWFITILIIGVLGCTFIPTRNDLLMIYGLGGTIDYVKSNDAAKQLPDKCVEALDAWVESLNKDN